MGFFTGLAVAFGFGDGGAGEAAGQIQAAGGAAQAGLNAQFEAARQNLAPSLIAGQDALQQTIQGSTAGGLDQRLGDIFGSQNFQNLRDERTRAVQGQLAAGGLTRSGQAVEDIANIPTELGFGIENQLFGRQQGLSSQGLGSINSLEQFRASNAAQNADIFRGIGGAQAQGILGGRANQAAGVGNLFGTISGGVTGLNQGGGFSNILRGIF